MTTVISPKVLSLAAASAASAFVCGTAEARIVCRDGYQVSGGQEISTPYCNDEYLAQVARERGTKVSAAEVRNNPNRKDEICRHIGYDIRIREYCPSDSDSDSGK
jgi:hypothetical protein